MRWATPLGWAEELRPFGGARPAVILLPLAASVALLFAGLWIAERRDVGSGVLAGRETAPPRLALLSSPTVQALRLGRASLIAWLTGVGAFAFIIGALASSISSAGISKSLAKQFAKLGSGSILTPTGYLGFTFIFFIFAVSLLAVAQISAAREEEASQRLETLFALPVARRRWLSGRLALAGAALVAVSLGSGVFAWLGATAVGVRLSFGLMLEAGANCLPVGLLFLGIAALAVCARAAGERGHRLRHRRYGVPLGPVRRTAGGTGVASADLPVRGRRPRARCAVQSRRGGRDARRRSRVCARRERGLPAPRPAQRLADSPASAALTARPDRLGWDRALAPVGAAGP